MYVCLMSRWGKKRKRAPKNQGRRAYKSQETSVKVRAYTLLRRNLVSSRVLDDLAYEARVSLVSLSAEPRRHKQEVPLSDAACAQARHKTVRVRPAQAQAPPPRAVQTRSPDSRQPSGTARTRS